LTRSKFSDFLFPSVESERRKSLLILLFLTILIQIGCVTLFFFEISPSKIILLAIAFLLFVFCVSSVERFFILLVVYASFTLLQSYANMYSGFLPFGVQRNYLYMGYVIFLIYWGFMLILKRKSLKQGAIGNAIIAYLFFASLALFVGILNGNKHITTIKENEFVPQLMYLSFFVFLTSGIKRVKPKLLLNFILGISVLIGIQFMYAFPKNSIISFTRIPTINVHIALLAFPYVLGIVFFANSSKRKLVSVLMLIPISFAVLISLQRGLWFAIGLQFILALILYFIRRGYTPLQIIKYLLLLLMIFAILLIIGLYGLSRMTSDEAVMVILKRFVSFANISYLRVDLSAFHRTFEIKQAFSRMSGIDWIIGRGIGDIFYSKVRFEMKDFVDNSFACVFWKMGILGLLAFLSIFVAFFQRFIYLLRKGVDNETFIYVMAIGLNICGLLVVALTNACLVHYRFIIVWAASMGLLEMIYRRRRDEIARNMLK
jgi:hypothetical protein